MPGPHAAPVAPTDAAPSCAGPSGGTPGPTPRCPRVRRDIAGSQASLERAALRRDPERRGRSPAPPGRTQCSGGLGQGRPLAKPCPPAPPRLPVSPGAAAGLGISRRALREGGDPDSLWVLPASPHPAPSAPSTLCLREPGQTTPPSLPPRAHAPSRPCMVPGHTGRRACAPGRQAPEVGFSGNFPQPSPRVLEARRPERWL